jgi:membrane protease YdiL (CAAX protease family)
MKISLSNQKNKGSFIEENRREIVIGFCALLAIIVRYVFPVKMTGEAFWINIFLFFLFPWVVIRFILKEKVKSFGLSLGDRKKGIIFSIIFIAVFGLINYFIVKTPSLRGQLQISPDIVRNFWIFLWFQIIISLTVHFSWEFFFRGFIQMGTEKNLGKYAIPVQAIAQTALYARSSWMIVLLIGFSSLFAGIITRQSRSILYSFVSMWLISLSLDIMIIRYIYQGTI